MLLSSITSRNRHQISAHDRAVSRTSMPADTPPPPGDSAPSIFTAIQEQLGLKLEPSKGPVQILVIESIERPTEN